MWGHNPNGQAQSLFFNTLNWLAKILLSQQQVLNIDAVQPWMISTYDVTARYI